MKYPFRNSSCTLIVKILVDAIKPTLSVFLLTLTACSFPQYAETPTVSKTPTKMPPTSTPTPSSSSTQQVPTEESKDDIVVHSGSPITTIYGGSTGDQTAAVTAEGIMYAWGLTDFSLTPISDTKPVIGFAGAIGHMLVLMQDGTVWAEGFNTFGQLGNGRTESNAMERSEVSELSDITMVAAGDYHSMALKSDGTVWTWGLNDSGQLGNGSQTDSLSPVQVQGLPEIVMITAGLDSSIALDVDGRVWGWGSNRCGQLGNDRLDYGTTPEMISSLTDIVSVSGGGDRVLALKDDGTVWTWGCNYAGEIGAGDTAGLIYNPVPTQVVQLSEVTAVFAGLGHSLVVKEDGTLWTWGDNDYGQLGNGTKEAQPSPEQVAGLTRVVAAAAGRHHSIALTEDGSVWAWGADPYLHHFDWISNLVPTKILGP